MTAGVKKKLDRSGRNKRLAAGDAELAVRFLQDDSSSDENTEEQLRVSYRQYSAMKKKNSQWTRTEKQLLTLIVISFVVILLLVALLVVNFAIFKEKETCDDVECVEVSGSLIRYMNLSADPCEDFYEYACGNFGNVLTVPPDKPKYSQFTVLSDKNTADLKRLLDEKGKYLNGVETIVVEKAKNFYAACMNMSATDTRGIDPILKVMEDVGSWTLTDGNSGSFDSSTWDLQKTLSKAFQYGVDPFFGYTVDPDSKNSKIQILTFDQTGLSFSRDHYLGNESKIYHDVFVDYFASIVELLGGSKVSAKSRASEIFEFESRLAKIQLNKEERRNQEKIYHKMTIQEVQKKLGTWIDLSSLLKDMFNENIPEDEPTQLFALEYFEKIEEIITHEPSDLLADYMMWHVVNAYTGYLPSSFLDTTLILKRALTGVDALPQRWMLCVGRTESILPYVTGALYIQNRFSATEKKEVEDILKRIISEFRHNLPTLKWMDDTTINKAIDKLDAVKQKIGYPQITQDIPKLEEFYAKLNVTPDNQFQNELNVVRFSLERMIGRRGKPPEEWMWGMTAEAVNAYYDPQKNEMVFPAGILKRPFYDPLYSKALNFGAIGVVMGHELTHGFDDSGRQFDKDGSLSNWWKNTSLKEFDKKTECMTNQYSQFTIEGKHVNGKYTLGENIADNGGMKTGFRAYMRWLDEFGKGGDEPKSLLPGLEFTEEQMFFLGFAQIWCYSVTPEYAKKAIVEDPHSPANVRVIGTLGNMKEFSEAFNCKTGSRMNPDHRCEVW